MNRQSGYYLSCARESFRRGLYGLAAEFSFRARRASTCRLDDARCDELDRKISAATGVRNPALRKADLPKLKHPAFYALGVESYGTAGGGREAFPPAVPLTLSL